MSEKKIALHPYLAQMMADASEKPRPDHGKVDVLRAHVGCGDLDAMGECDKCNAIRQQLARVQELERDLESRIDVQLVRESQLVKQIQAAEGRHADALTKVEELEREVARLKVATVNWKGLKEAASTMGVGLDADNAYWGSYVRLLDESLT